ncbi:hypothetical protein ACFQEQ_04560, partial [Halolamina salina]
MAGSVVGDCNGNRGGVSIVGYWDSTRDSISMLDHLRPQGAGHEARRCTESPPLPPRAPTVGAREASTATAPRSLSARS